MAKITCSLVLLFLTVTASSISAAAGAAPISATLKKVKNWLEGVTKVGEVMNKTTHDLPLRRRHLLHAEERSLPAAVVDVEGLRFTVAGLDVTSPVTYTSRCAGRSAVPPCGHSRPCKLYGNIALLDADNKEIVSIDNAAYACRPNTAGNDDDDYAVIGLAGGKLGNAILAQSPPLFSYIIDAGGLGNGLSSTVWIGRDAEQLINTAATHRGRSTTVLSATSGYYYSVSIAGIKVGSGGDVGGGEAAGVLMTTMPFTLLNPALFGHLSKEISAVVSPAVGIDAGQGQLCYPKGTKLPAITLVLGGDGDGMELTPEHYSYEDSSGVVCLSILPTPWSSGESIIGALLQAGRRMTYKLDSNTLTFDV